jgi:hypothetical protein
MGCVPLGCGRRSFDPPEADAMFDSSEAPAANNYVFVTSTTHLPATFGADLSGADAICAARAQAADLAGTYVAWLSSSTVHARERLTGARGWIRMDGRPVVDRVEDLIAGRLFYPIRMDEHGEDVGVLGARVATGTRGTGEVAAETCMDYTDPAANVQGGYPWQTRVGWTNDSAGPCSTAMRIYCFGIDLGVPVTVVPVQGRRAFVSATLFGLDGGLSGADAICDSDAMLAGLPGTYRALLGTASEPAAARFDLTGANWVRVDGVPLAASPLAFMSGQVETTMLDPLGVPQNTTIATGGAPLTPYNGTCTDWTTTTGTHVVGRSNTTSNDMFFAGSGGLCATPKPVYCLEP